MTTARRKGTRQPTARLFEEFSIEQLMRLIPYSESYLDELATGRQPIRPRFRRTVSRCLGRPEAELFDEAGSTESSREAAQSQDGRVA